MYREHSQLMPLLILVFFIMSMGNPYAENCFPKQGDVDLDKDGLSDALEKCIAEKHAPVLYLPPSHIDKFRPASVDWYLARTTLRFNHDNLCRDELIDEHPTITKLANNKHQIKDLWCRHAFPTIHAKITESNQIDDNNYFFLKLDSKELRSGSSNSEDWKVYVHTYPGKLGGIMVSYWYFFPYNDNLSLINHEGDWEHITLSLDNNYQVEFGVFYAHMISSKIRSSDINWLNGQEGGHPLVWIADGSHASYWRNSDECNRNWREGSDTSCFSDDNYRWFTWKNAKNAEFGIQGGGLVHVGEIANPLNDQHWIQFLGRWGEVGTFSLTTGPATPAMCSSWNFGLGQSSSTTTAFIR